MKELFSFVLHIPAHKPSALPTLLCHAGPLRALHPIDNALIERERIYVAPPDCHLLVEVGQVRLSRDLKEKVCIFFPQGVKLFGQMA